MAVSVIHPSGAILSFEAQQGAITHMVLSKDSQGYYVSVFNSLTGDRVGFFRLQ